MHSQMSQFFVVSPRGDTIIRKEFRGDLPQSTSDVFFRHCKFYGGVQQEAPPVFFIDGVTFMYLKNNGLYFVATTKANVCASLMMELISSITKVFKDYCGVLTEQSIRRNFILLYELLDEVMDYGYCQGISSDILKAFVFETPIADTSSHSTFNKVPKVLSGSQKTIGHQATNRIIIEDASSSKKRRKKQKNEIFVDIFEGISVTFDNKSNAVSSSIDGNITMKSYLGGNPELKLALNEDLSIASANFNRGGNSNISYGGGNVCLDDINFHQNVNCMDFEQNRILHILPPEGEFNLLNYRVTTSEFRYPFRIFPYIEMLSAYKIDLIMKIRADIPEQNYAGNVQIILPIPQSFAQNVTLIPQNSSTSKRGNVCKGEYVLQDQRVVWNIKKFRGGTEEQFEVKITTKDKYNLNSAVVKKLLGPISMKFEIPMYSVSGLQVRYLKIMENHKKYNPYRWIRYVTKSQSYICRL